MNQENNRDAARLLDALAIVAAKFEIEPYRDVWTYLSTHPTRTTSSADGPICSFDDAGYLRIQLEHAHALTAIRTYRTGFRLHKRVEPFSVEVSIEMGGFAGPCEPLRSSVSWPGHGWQALTRAAARASVYQDWIERTTRAEFVIAEAVRKIGDPGPVFEILDDARGALYDAWRESTGDDDIAF